MQKDAIVDELKLPKTLDLAAAQDLLATIRGRLQADQRLRVDASEIQSISLPCMQIIMAALRSDGRISIERPSEAYINAFNELGIDCDSLRGAGAIEPDAQASEPAQGAAPLPQTEETLMTKRILTIDDSKTIRDMLMFTLADAGFEVLQAVDGQHGIDVLKNEQVDVVITDINMPRMDGYEVIRHMRSNSAHKTTPILVLTTESEIEKRDIARAAGATGWMVKPFDPDRLIATINKVAP